MVSAVPPDLLITFTRTRRGSMRRSAAAHGGGIHVLEHRQPRKEFARLVVQLVPGGTAQRIEQRLGAERRAADAEHQDVIVGLAHAFGEGGDLADGFGLIDQLVEAVLAGARVGDGPPAAPPRIGAASSARRARGSPCAPSSPSRSMRP